MCRVSRSAEMGSDYVLSASTLLRAGVFFGLTLQALVSRRVAHFQRAVGHFAQDRIGALRRYVSFRPIADIVPKMLTAGLCQFQT